MNKFQPDLMEILSVQEMHGSAYRLGWNENLDISILVIPHNLQTNHYLVMTWYRAGIRAELAGLLALPVHNF